MRKAQGISMNVIIIAALALLVLVVLSIIFVGRMGTWSGQVSDCENKGGKCFNDCATDGAAAGYPTPFTQWRCDSASLVCCIPAS